jgi:two-component system, response regulator, stage 0 sporulation protein F
VTVNLGISSHDRIGYATSLRRRLRAAWASEGPRAFGNPPEWRGFRRTPSADPPAPAPAEGPGASPPRARKWVLVVDDDSGTRRLLTRILEQDGHVPVAAASGTVACEILRDLRPHLILLDLRMPGMSGMEFLAHRYTTPVVVISGHLGEHDGEALRHPNVVAALEKPFDLEVLRSTVATALGR